MFAEEAPLQEILRQLRVFGIASQIDPVLNPGISAVFDRRPLEESLADLLKPLNYVMIWESLEGEEGAAPHLVALRIHEAGQKERMAPLFGRPRRAIARDPVSGLLYVQGEILLQLKPGLSNARLEALIERAGGCLLGFNPETGIGHLRLPPGTDIGAQIAQIQQDPRVESVEPNYVYPVPAPLRSTRIASAAADIEMPIGSKTGAPVAIFDTGMAALPELENLSVAALDTLDPRQPISDDLGHGTQMAYIASGLVKPEGAAGTDTAPVSIIPIRAFDENGFISNDDLLEGLEFAAQNGARVVSLSWGSENPSVFLEKAMQYADQKGLMVVAAAGNEPTGKPVYPAAYDTVLAVGALQPDGKPWEQSNYGGFVQCFAPGFATLPVGYNGAPGPYAGTSIATAFLANAAAAYWAEHPEATRDEVLQALAKHH